MTKIIFELFMGGKVLWFSFNSQALKIIQALNATLLEYWLKNMLEEEEFLREASKVVLLLINAKYKGLQVQKDTAIQRETSVQMRHFYRNRYIHTNKGFYIE